ncbi:MAG: 4-hydroxy-tetrahydrodipicolinate synthase [Defluviitaleaceae bacterium]|nr:4-hydroxy-tetrahydrodipicolinate synthase [Defluviitaleaceae bacterium]
MTFNLKGSIPALITPFKADRTVDYDRLSHLIEFHIEQSSAAILILGTTGESCTMTFEEEKEMVAFVVNHAAGRIPIIAGSGSNATATAVEASLAFEALGVDALLLITPYYNRTNDSGLIKHFESVANEVNIPIILYTVPARTGCHLPVHVVEQLAQHDRIVGIKDATGDFSYAVKVSRLVSDTFHLYSGNDDTIVPLLSLGASGVISVWANFMPATVQKLVMTYLAGNTDESLRLQHHYLDLVHALFIETNPIPLKYVMQQLGLDSGFMRLPLDELSPAGKQHINPLLTTEIKQLVNQKGGS